MRAKLREVKEELRRRMHEPIPEQGKWLRQVVAGFFNYHAVPTNSDALVVPLVLDLAVNFRIDGSATPEMHRDRETKCRKEVYREAQLCGA
jgi:hypothetical protein